MQQSPQPEMLNSLAQCLAWSHDEKPMTLDDISVFIRSIAIEEPDPAVASVLYQKYCEAIDETALDLAKKIRGRTLIDNRVQLQRVD